MTTTSRFRQISYSEIPNLRKQHSISQKYKCPICKCSLATGAVALDHDHGNGMIRGALCQSCNTSEGKVKFGILFRTAKTNLAFKDPVSWLRNLANYLEHHKKRPSGQIHPTFDQKTGKQISKRKSTRRK